MHLRALIQGRAPAKPDDGIQISSPRTPATVAIVATLRPEIPSTVARVATVAASGEPESWPDRLRSLPSVDGVRWDLAADALESLLRAGVIDKALALGWDAREIIGVCRSRPHGAPHCAGLIFSMRAGDTVGDVRRSGCIIAYGNVRHIWKRAPIAAAICLPWELAPPDVWET